MSNREQREMLEQLDNLKAEMKSYLDNNDIENAKAKKLEIEALSEKIYLYEDINKEININNFMEVESMNKNVNKEFNNALMGKDYDNALVQRAVDANGGYLVPEEQLAVIEEYRREQIELKGHCRHLASNSGKGVIPVEVEADMMLANLTEGEEIPQSQVNFGQVAYDVKDYGDIVPVSRQVLQDENCGLMEYIGGRFAKKAVHTENAKILEALMANEENHYVEADILKGLNKALNVKLDPANAMNAVIIMNQSKFDELDNMLDANERAILNPMPQDATKKMYKGHEIIVMNDAVLELNGCIVADMANAVLFVERLGVEVAVSEEAGFTKNVVYARVIERFDVQAIDKKAVCVVKQA